MTYIVFMNNAMFCIQGLLGVFFKIEAVALFEDIETALTECTDKDQNCEGNLNNVEYYSQNDVTQAYSNAA